MVCFDIDKRGLVAGAFANAYLSRKSHVKRSVIFHKHDMNQPLSPILSSFKVMTKLPIIVLFQHPSPSKEVKSRDAIARASLDCISCLASETVQSVNFVYDGHPDPRKNCWRGNRLRNHCISKCSVLDLDKVVLSDPVIICTMKDRHFNHPIFGPIDRRGWASMKQGNEVTFHIVKKSNM